MTRTATQLDAEKTAIQKKDSPLGPDKLQEEYDKVSARLPGESAEAAAAQNLRAEGQALATAISTFVTASVSAGGRGSAPVVRAAHGEVLSKTGTAILYAQIIAAGDDQFLSDPHPQHMEQPDRPDRRVCLAGALARPGRGL